MTGACSVCKYWNASSAWLRSTERPRAPFECRFREPRAPGTAAEAHLRAVWPVTWSDDWCGKFDRLDRSADEVRTMEAHWNHMHDVHDGSQP